MKFFIKFGRYIFEVCLKESKSSSIVDTKLAISFKKEIYNKYSTEIQSFDILKLVTISNKLKLITIFNKRYNYGTFKIKDNQ